MTQPEFLTGKIAAAAANVARENRPWVVALGRFGHASNGIVYLLVGAQAALGAIGGIEGSLSRLTASAWGTVALRVLVVGLSGYALWNLIQAVFDTENLGTGFKGLIDRSGYAVVSLLYGGLAWSLVRILHGMGREDRQREWTARLLADPVGRWFVIVVGMIVSAVGVAQFCKAVSADFRNSLKLHQMASEERAWIVNVARVGFISRGVVGLITGLFFIVAARDVDADETKGLAESLQVLRDQPYGPWLLAVVALGLAAYGVYMIVLARYRRMIRK